MRPDLRLCFRYALPIPVIALQDHLLVRIVNMGFYLKLGGRLKKVING